MKSILAFLLGGLPSTVFALPQYATELRVTQCTACHLDPGGGGFRNLNGKNFGSKNLEPSPFSKSDWYFGDLRFIYYRPQNAKTARDGLGLMAAVVGVNAPLKQTGPQINLVLNHSLTGFGSDREVYLRFKNGEDPSQQWSPQYILFGRLHLPFGLRTDEHRTYARVATASSWNQFVTGAMLSADPAEDFHYDIAIANGESEYLTASGFQNGKVDRWAVIANLRWMPTSPSWPLMLGLSSLRFDRTGTTLPEASAHAIYTVVSIGRRTLQKFPLTISLEINRAFGLNSNNGELDRLITDATYLASARDSESRSLWAQLDYELSSKWTLTYKYDELWLDKNFPADAYKRHGIGFKHQMAANLFGKARYENASAWHPSENVPNQKGAAQNAFWFLLQAAF